VCVCAREGGERERVRVRERPRDHTRAVRKEGEREWRE